MNSKLASFSTALKAELLKKKGTGFFYFSAIFGLIAPLLFFVVSIIQSNENISPKFPFNHYLEFTTNSLIPYAYFFFPLMIIILVSRITQLDHKNGGWQLMETQPISKFAIYFSKFTLVLASLVLSAVTFVLSCVLLGWLLTLIIPISKEAIVVIPYVELSNIFCRLIVAALFIAALQYAISVLISSFIWSILIGFFGLLLTIFLRPFHLVPVWYPYEILAKIADTTEGSDLGYWFTFTETISFLCSIVFLYIGFNWYRFKSFSRAFFKPKQAISLALMLLFFGVLIGWLIQPNEMQQHSATVFSGKIESDENFKNIYILDLVVNDTIAIFPVKNNEFKGKIDANIETDFYSMVFDGKYNEPIFLGTDDSTFVVVKIYYNQVQKTVFGTRLPENRLKKADDRSWSSVEYYINQNINIDKPDLISEDLYDEWKEKIAESNSFRTVDNYVAKADYNQRAKKLITVKYLNTWNSYLEKRRALYPNKKTLENSKISEMRKFLSVEDESLLSEESYFNYVKNQLTASNKAEIAENTKALIAISALKNSSFKDKMLFWQMKKSLEEASNAAERKGLIANYNHKFQQEKFKKRVNSLYKMIESLAKGKQAPTFAATSVNEKRFNLADFKGKYVLIDVWATWCGPCKFQSPYFEKFALKYKTQNIQFLSLSVDQNKTSWFVQAENKSNLMPQLHLDDPKQFMKDYNVESIPRFILIDPNGNFINAKMPFPSETSFEIILRKALNLPDEM